MANITVFDAKGAKVREFSFSDAFLPEAPHVHLMHLHVIRQLRHKRAGTASTSCGRTSSESPATSPATSARSQSRRGTGAAASAAAMSSRSPATASVISAGV